MRSLTPDQIKQIRDKFIANDYSKEWIIFHVCVSKTGATVGITFSYSPEEMEPDSWNGYDMSIHLDDVITLLEKYNLP